MPQAVFISTTNFINELGEHRLLRFSFKFLGNDVIHFINEDHTLLKNQKILKVSHDSNSLLPDA
jgi:hypothetical protein